MGEVNEFFKNRYEDEQEQFRRMIRRHRVINVYRMILGVLILAVSIGIFYMSNQNKVYTDYSVIRKTEYTAAATADYREFNGNVLRFSKDGASAFNLENDMIWNETYEMQNPMVDVCGDYVALGDYKGTQIFVLNSNGLVGKIDTMIPLRAFFVSGTGNVAAVLEEEEVTWIKLYDQTGVNIASDRSTMAKTGYPVDVDISDNGILMAVSYLYIDSGEISSSVAFYNFGSVGQNEIDNLVSGYDYDNTIDSYVNFMNEKTCIAVGDNKLSFFSGNQKPQKVTDIDITEEIQSVFHGHDYVGLVYNGNPGAPKHRIDVYDTEGTLVMSQTFDLDYSDVLLDKDLIVIYNNEHCEIYNLQGVKKFDGDFHDSVIRLIPTKSKTRFLLVSGGKMEEIQLR